MNIGILEQMGLSRNEIKAYFSLLELGQASATPIIKQSGIPHSKVYPILEKLIKKGLVSYVIKNNIRYFQASHPGRLLDLLQKREKQILNQKKELKHLIQKIEVKRTKMQEKQEAQVYEGVAGVKAALNTLLDTLHPGESYQVFTLGEELKLDTLKRFFKTFHSKRQQKKISARLLANFAIKTLFSKYHLYKGMRIRYSNLKLPTGVFIYHDKVLHIIWNEQPTAFVITSKRYAEQYQEFFDEIWKKSLRGYFGGLYKRKKRR